MRELVLEPGFKFLGEMAEGQDELSQNRDVFFLGENEEGHPVWELAACDGDGFKVVDL